jgi:23S rRNA (pseudouridine1915-N3)-methyltransferase
MKIRILWPGKTKKEYYRAAIEDYVARIRKFVPLEIIEVREQPLKDRQRTKRVRWESKQLATKRQSSATVLLDSSGKMLTSEEFSEWLQNVTGDVDFILGGPAGVETTENLLRFSFGKVTLPHELARVVLLEQIYRALVIQRHHPYHK